MLPAVVVVVFFTVAVACGHRHATANDAKKFTVTGSVVIREDYCGGAQLVNEDRPAVPASGTTLYIRKSGGSKTVIDSIKTNDKGAFSISLSAGEYCIVEKWKKYPLVFPVNTDFQKWDTACYRKRYNECDFTLNVKSDTSDVKFILRKHCPWTTPCVQYSGPFPPAAPPTNRGGFQPGHQE